MHTWTRSERFGCWGLLVGVITCGAVVYSVVRAERPATPATVEELAASTGDPALDTEVRRARERLLIEQGAAARDELRRLHEERVEVWKERMKTRAELDRRDGTTEHDSIGLRNSCTIPIDVALAYTALDDRWVSRGWWRVEPGETRQTDALTRYANLYFYAENLSAGWQLDGRGKPESLDLEITDARFDHFHGEPFVYDTPRIVSFYKRSTGEDWTNWVEDFQCLAEAPTTPAAAAPLPAERAQD